MKLGVDGVIREMTDEEIAAYEASFTPTADGPYSLYKTTLWVRLTDAEAETVMAAKNQQPAKFRGIWDDALTIQSNSQFFGTLKQFLAATLSAKRADELLAPGT